MDCSESFGTQRSQGRRSRRCRPVVQQLLHGGGAGLGIRVVREQGADGIGQLQLTCRHQLQDGHVRERLVDRSDVEADLRRVGHAFDLVGLAVAAGEGRAGAASDEDHAREVAGTRLRREPGVECLLQLRIGSSRPTPAVPELAATSSRPPPASTWMPKRSIRRVGASSMARFARPRQARRACDLEDDSVGRRLRADQRHRPEIGPQPAHHFGTLIGWTPFEEAWCAVHPRHRLERVGITGCERAEEGVDVRTCRRFRRVGERRLCHGRRAGEEQACKKGGKTMAGRTCRPS